MKNVNYTGLNERAFDILSTSYKNRGDINRVYFSKSAKPFIDYLLKNFITPSVLEIGPGAGVTLDILEKIGIKTAAIDISLEMIKIAREQSPKTEYIHNDFLKYDFQNRTFQGIFAKQVFHLFPQNKAKELLRKIHLLLDERGIFYLSILLYSEFREGFEKRVSEGILFEEFRTRYSEKEVMSIIRSSDFSIHQKSINRFKDTAGEVVNGLELLLTK